MNTTLLGFDFICTQPVPFYQYLCERLLAQHKRDSKEQPVPEISLNIGYVKSGRYRYRIEAQGTQAQLEMLADQIANDFLLSVHLIKANTGQLEKRQGVTKIANSITAQTEQSERKGWFKKPQSKQTPSGQSRLKQDVLSLHQHIQLDYCQTCTPQFGDNQSPQFGEIDLECVCCQGEQRYLASKQNNVTDGHSIKNTLTKESILALAQTLLTDKTISIDALGLELSLDDSFFNDSDQMRPQVLICNPNTLSQYFKATSEQVVTLSCFEKPAITLTTANVFEAKDSSHHSHNNCLLNNIPRCDVRFAYNRALIILTERLRQKGIDWVYYRSTHPIPLMTFIDEQWIYLQQPHALSFTTPHDPLHDDAVIESKFEQNKQYKSYGYQAQSKRDRIMVERIELSDSNLKPQDQGIHALLAQQYSSALPPQKDMAVLFFSSNYPSQIITSNSLNDSGRITKDKAEKTVSFPLFPATGDKLIQQLRTSITPTIAGNLLTQTNIIDKFQHAYPERYQALSQIKLGEQRDNLHSLLVVTAAILGQYHPPNLSDDAAITEIENQRANQQAIDHLLAHAETFQSEHSPRVDFPKYTLPKLSLSELALTRESVQTRFEDMVCFDWCQTFKSLISFCLAENSMDKENKQENDYVARLGFGFLDSLADEITKWIDGADNSVGVKHIALAGSDFQYAAFTKRLVRRLSVNYTVQANWQLDLEGANLAVGALYLPQRRAF